jgi:hydroxyacylglutathione hydrolase
MGLRIERIPTLRDNYTYLLICDETGEAAVVDAPEAGPVVARVEATGARVAKILSTHHHPDHAMANPELAIGVGRARARILHIPAHTRGHIAYVFDDAQAVFCGDTMFAGGCGRLFEGTPEMMWTALHEKLGRLPDATRVYCGHEYTESNLVFAAHVEPGNLAVQAKLEQVRARRARAAANWHDATPEEMTVPSTLAEEHATNPFLRAGSAAELGRRRALKDNFRG